MNDFNGSMLGYTMLELLNKFFHPKNITSVYARIADDYGFEIFFDQDFIIQLNEILKKIDRNLHYSNFIFHATIKKKEEGYDSYLSDLTIERVVKHYQDDSLYKCEFWPSILLYHKFDPGFDGQIRIRRKSTFLSIYSESILGLKRASLVNPMEGFENKIFVSVFDPAPLQKLIGVDVQEFLLRSYKEYPFTLMDHPFDGIYIGKFGIFYINRRTLKRGDIEKYLMFGEKFTSLIRSLLDN